MRARVAMAVALAAVAALSIGALTASARPAGKQDTVNLKMLAASSQQIPMDILVANFQRQFPNIHIDVSYVVSGSVPTVLLTQLQAGNAPDIFRIQGGVAETGVWPLAQAGRLLDLSKQKWVPRMYKPAKSLYSFNGKVYGWPLSVNPYAVLYNKDIFTQLKLTAPKSFADVLSMCRKINAAGKVPFVQPWGNITAANIIAPQRAAEYVYAVDPNWDDKRAKKQVTFASSPLWHRALQSIVDMKDANCFQPNAQGMTQRPSQYASFANGEAAMTVIASSELVNFLAINPNLHYGMFNLPGDNPKKSPLLAGAPIGIAGNAATSHPNEVKTFLDFMAREQQSSLFAKVSGEIAPLDFKKLKLPAYMQTYLTPMVKSGNFVELNARTWPNAQVFAQGLAGATLGLFTGQQSVDTILQTMDRLWDTP